MKREEYNILFVDVRGFTKWSSGIEAYEHLDEFVDNFYKMINEIFPNTYRKTLGDGAMIIEKIDFDVNKKSINDKLKDNLEKIKKVNELFRQLCDDFELKNGYETKLRLGWGITRGAAKRIGEDYVGENVNKCRRLCSDARPFGIIIEKNDFPELPRKPLFNFTHQNRKFDGIDNDVNVWVTDEIATQFIPREKIREKPEVHIAGICIKEEVDGIKLLIAKRNSDRKVFPNLYEGCGGQLKYSEKFIDGVKRHFKLEMHIDVDVLEEIHIFYEIRQPNEPLIPGISFLCEYKDGKPESLNHSKVEWVSEDQFKAIHPSEFIPGIKEEIKRLLEMYRIDYKK